MQASPCMLNSHCYRSYEARLGTRWTRRPPGMAEASWTRQLTGFMQVFFGRPAPSRHNILQEPTAAVMDGRLGRPSSQGLLLMVVGNLGEDLVPSCMSVLHPDGLPALFHVSWVTQLVLSRPRFLVYRRGLSQAVVGSQRFQKGLAISQLPRLNTTHRFTTLAFHRGP
jgi:hypothetical protein